MAKIIWDYEQIRAFSRQLERCIETLRTQQTRLQSLQTEAAGGWVSEAGRLYGERLDDDMDAIARAVQTFTTVNGQLAQTVRAYAGGELETFNRLNQQCYNQLSVR